MRKKKHGVFLFEMDQNHLMRLSPFASIFLHVGVCACVCVICEHWCLHLVGTHVCLGGHPCLCTWRPEISTASPLQLLCTFYVEVGSLGWTQNSRMESSWVAWGSRLSLLHARIIGRLLYPPSITVGTGDLNSILHTYMGKCFTLWDICIAPYFSL